MSMIEMVLPRIYKPVQTNSQRTHVNEWAAMPMIGVFLPMIGMATQTFKQPTALIRQAMSIIGRPWRIGIALPIGVTTQMINLPTAIITQTMPMIGRSC